MNFLLDFELSLFLFSCLLLLKISPTNVLLVESPFLWFLFRLQFLLQLRGLLSTAFNSGKRKTQAVVYDVPLGFGAKKELRDSFVVQ